MAITINGTCIETVTGDITRERVDAIVNAANRSLLGGGGVDGAIHAAAGPGLLEECREVRRTRFPQGLPVGEAVATGSGDLPARWVVHTVGPNRHRGQRDPALLTSCFRVSLIRAAELGAVSVAFPAISTGVYGYPLGEAAHIALKTAVDYLRGHEDIELIRFVLFDRGTYDVFVTELKKII